MTRYHDMLSLLVAMGEHPAGTVFRLFGAHRNVRRCSEHLGDLPITMGAMLEEGVTVELAEQECPTCRDGRVISELPEVHANGSIYHYGWGRGNAPPT